MKRRTFLTASSTFGIAGAVSGASVVSSVYTSINTSVLLEEFSPKAKDALDKFMAEAIQNTQALGLDEKLAASIVMPVHIISKKTLGHNQEIVYKNKSGQHISLSVVKGVAKINVLKVA